jgi:hypothetical protein
MAQPTTILLTSGKFNLLKDGLRPSGIELIAKGSGQQSGQMSIQGWECKFGSVRSGHIETSIELSGNSSSERRLWLSLVSAGSGADLRVIETFAYSGIACGGEWDNPPAMFNSIFLSPFPPVQSIRFLAQRAGVLQPGGKENETEFDRRFPRARVRAGHGNVQIVTGPVADSTPNHAESFLALTFKHSLSQFQCRTRALVVHKLSRLMVQNGFAVVSC